MAGKIFVIADLHLSFGTDKPMDIFGKAWENHAARLEENWKQTVSEDDIVIVPGDLSWGLKEHEVIPDLAFIDSLPGRKILMKGNHELWWSSLTRLRQLRDDKAFSTLYFLYNNAIYIEDRDVIVCGTRGWKCPGEKDFTANDMKIYKRELIRLQLSADYGKKLREACIEAKTSGKELPPESMGVITLDRGADNAALAVDGHPEKIFCFHFPPIAARDEGSSGFVEIMENEGADKCYFGHLHGMGRAHFNENGKAKPFMKAKDVDCYLTAADYLGLTPLRII